jgi:hypothetical protein
MLDYFSWFFTFQYRYKKTPETPHQAGYTAYADFTSVGSVITPNLEHVKYVLIFIFWPRKLFLLEAIISLLPLLIYLCLLSPP